MEFLAPTREKIIFLIVFLIISIGGYIQSYAFSEVGAKPIFYDAVRPFPFWEIWAIIILPMAFFSWLLADFYLFIVLMLVYLYLLSCLLHLASGRVVGWGASIQKNKRSFYAKAFQHPHAPAFVGLGAVILFIILVLVVLPLVQSALVLLLRG